MVDIPLPVPESGVDAQEPELAAVSGQLPAIFAVLSGPNHVLDTANAALFETLGIGRARIGEPLASVVPELAEQGIIDRFDEVYRTGRGYTATDVLVRLGSGERAHQSCFDFTFEPRRDAREQVVGVTVTGVETTQVKHAQQLTASLRVLLEHIAEDAPVQQVLSDMAATIETFTPGSLVSVLLADDDGHRLRHGTAPSLPESYNRAIDGIEIAEGNGSCGTSAHRLEPVIVTDIATDPLWQNYRASAAQAGLAACWSRPILASDGTLLGTFAIYHRTACAPQESDLTLSAVFARTAALAIERGTNQWARAVAEANERATSEARAELVRDLQATLRPPDPPTIPGLDIAAYYRPAGEGLDVGGDFYDVLPVAENQWALVIGDVCGHGALAASTTGLVRHTLRAVARLFDDPVSAVSAVNTALLERPPHHGSGFVTLLYGLLTSSGDATTVDLVRAGHLPPLICRADGTVEAPEAPGMLLGIQPDPGLQTHRVMLHPGDSLIMITDGFTEARSATGELFGEERLYECLKSAAATGAQGQLATFVHAVEEHCSGTASRADDDRAALVLRKH